MKPWWSVLLVVALMWGCRAGDDTRRGEINEYCNGGVDDCRAGLECLDGLCTDNTGDTEYSCGDFCANLATCGAAEGSCIADCRVTIQSWSFEAQDSFTRCGVELTCGEIDAIEFVPQECYSRIPVAWDRAERCEFLTNVALGCGSREEAVRVQTSCTGLARVSDVQTWSTSERCVAAADVGICSGIATCFNEVFGLSPGLSWGDDELTPSPLPAVDTP